MHTLPAPVRATAARVTTTPNARMTTLASPSLGAAETLSMWRVEMAQASAGPLHTFDSEQIWSVLDGELEVSIEGAAHRLSSGDTLVVPAGLSRQVTARATSRAIVCGRSDAVVSVAGEDAARGTPPWIS